LIEKIKVWATILILTVALTSVLAAYSFAGGQFVLAPKGPLRVALHAEGSGSASWYAVAPRVFDGSFSAELYSGMPGPFASNPAAGGTVSGARMLIGPLSIPLTSLTPNGIKFWVYHLTSIIRQPRVILVLDNGREIIGNPATTLDPSAKLICETGFACQGYASADIWVQMVPVDKWYNALASKDPVQSPVKDCYSLDHSCPLAAWQKAFPDARVIQVQVIVGFDYTIQTVYVDDVMIGDTIVLVEPETIAAADV
jgi:hypothetical protein